MIVSIFGPTAVGKSRVAVEVASALGGEIISADSMQVYRGLPILTDQPSHELLHKVQHHLIATVPLDVEYSAARYVSEASGVLSDIIERGKLPVIVGGTGLYLQALLGDFTFAGYGGMDIREKWVRYIGSEGIEAAYEELLELDPEAAALVDRNNPRRLARALEAAESEGPSIAEERRLWASPEASGVLYFGLERDREDLYQAIDDRVDTMLAAGAIDEVRNALCGKVSRTASQTIGFAELTAYLEGGLTLEEVADSIKQRSRRYAKRQLTWMRKMPDIARIVLSAVEATDAGRTIIKRISR